MTSALFTTYIARDSQVYARRMIARIKARVEGILFPDSSAMVPEWERENIRETFVANYRINYRIKSDELIEILTVIHGARRLPAETDVVPD